MLRPAVRIKDGLTANEENDICLELRQVSQKQRFAWILSVLDINAIVGLRLARRCIRARSHFAKILEIGLDTADASTMRTWLDTTVPPLGLRTVVRILQSRVQLDARAVKMALYFLPRYAENAGSEALAGVDELRAAVSANDTQRRLSEEEPESLGS